MLRQEADHYHDEAGRRTAALTTAMTVLVWLIVAGFIVFFVFRVFLSYLDLFNQVGMRRSAMLGAIAGDVIGSIYEGASLKTQYFHPLIDAACRFTDDTVLTVAVADAILTGADYIDKLKEYCWLYPYAGYGGTFLRWAVSLSRVPYNSWGNGSAMRVSPGRLRLRNAGGSAGAGEAQRRGHAQPPRRSEGLRRPWPRPFSSAHGEKQGRDQGIRPSPI